MQKNKYIPRYTYADYCLWEGDWELIDGHPYAMAPSPFGQHQRILREFTTAISIELKKKRCTCEAFSDLDWNIDDENVVRPDAMIVCGKKVMKHLEYAPVWIVEILSQSTAFRDQIIKKELYAEQGVKYYLIADTDKKSVIIFELVNGEYQIKTDAHFDLTDHCSISLNMEEIMNA
jgi:Uma2 family endonuclease